MPLARRGEGFVSIPGCWSRYDSTRLLSMLTWLVFSYCTGVYMNCRDAKRCVEVIARAESTLMTMTRFSAAYQNGNSSHSFGHLQFDHHRCGILVPMLTSVLENVEIPCLYGVIRPVDYDAVLCLLALRRSQEFYCLRFDDRDLVFFGCGFKTRQTFDVPPLHANKRSKTGTSTILDDSGRKIRWIYKMQFSSNQSGKSKWRELGGDAGSAGGCEVGFDDRQILSDLELLFERDAG